MYCQRQYTQLQIVTMCQPPGSHHQLHELHLTATQAPFILSSVGILPLSKLILPLHYGDVPTHAGAKASVSGFQNMT